MSEPAWMKDAPPKPEGKPGVIYVGQDDVYERPDKDGKVTWWKMWLQKGGAYDGEWRGQVFRGTRQAMMKPYEALDGTIWPVVEDPEFIRKATPLSKARAAFIERNKRADAMEGLFRPEYVKATREGRG